MKKLLSLFICSIIMFSVTSCGNSPDVDLTTESTTEEITTSEESTTVEATSETEIMDEITIKVSSVFTASEQSEKENTAKATETTAKNDSTTTKQTEITTKQQITTTTTARFATATQPTSTTQAVFDVNVYIQYAIVYGKSIGLTYHSGVYESWDNPIAVHSNVADSYIKSSIESKLNRYKNVEGFEYFNAWSESTGDGKYRIMIAYA